MSGKFPRWFVVEKVYNIIGVWEYENSKHLPLFDWPSVAHVLIIAVQLFKTTRITRYTYGETVSH